jgi:hypothetical protein
MRGNPIPFDLEAYLSFATRTATITKDMEPSPPSLASGIIEHAAPRSDLVHLWLHGRSMHTQRA